MHSSRASRRPSAAHLFHARGGVLQMMTAAAMTYIATSRLRKTNTVMKCLAARQTRRKEEKKKKKEKTNGQEYGSNGSVPGCSEDVLRRQAFTRLTKKKIISSATEWETCSCASRDNTQHPEVSAEVLGFVCVAKIVGKVLHPPFSHFYHPN